MNAAGGLYLGKQIVHGADSAISKVADVDTMKRRLELAWGSTPHATQLAAEAVAKSRDLSGKYKNTTIAENLHIVDDLRSNLPETAEDILHHSLEPFVKLHSFFKAYKGGKHAGSAEQSLKDIGTAVRSGELGGNVTGDQMAKWAQDLAYMRVQFGEKFKLDEYFKAQKAARYSLPGTSDRFKTVAFPVMVQSMGIGAGVALATLYNKLSSGVTIHQSTAEAWRALGLVDMNKVGLSKNGKIDPGSLPNSGWLKGNEQFGTDPDRFIFSKVLPAMAKKGGIAGLTPEIAAQLDKAHAGNDVETLSKLLPGFIRNQKFIDSMVALGKDRNAGQAMWVMVERAASTARDARGKEGIENGKGEYDGYDVAKQRLAASLDRAANDAFGKDSIGVIIYGLDALSGAIEGVGKSAKELSENGLLKFLAGGDKKGGVIGDGLLGQAWNYVFGNKDAAPSYPGLHTMSPESAAIAERAAASANARMSPFDQFQRLPEAPKGYKDMLPKFFQLGPESVNPMSWSGRSFSADAASAIPQSVAVKVDPIQVNIPSSIPITVTVTGTVNGPVNGSGNGEIGGISATAGRGTATPDAGAGSGQSSP